MNTAELEKTENAESTAPVKENKMGVLPVGKLVFSMSLPMMVSMLVQALYNIVDSLFVSQINQNAFTGVSLAFPLQNLMIAVGVGTGVGVNANLARALGEKKFEKANKFARHGIFLAVSEEGDDTRSFLDEVHDLVRSYYGDDFYVVGNSTSAVDLSSSFAEDNLLISILSALFVMLILLFTFKSAGLPVLLILVIQGSIWLNFSVPAIENTPLYFLGYLIVNSIQMGANIDYAIVISSHYTELKQQYPPKKAIVEALNASFPTIFTSGTILAAAGSLIAVMTTNPVIATIGDCLGRGTIISIVLVLAVLPQILVLGDTIIERTSFEMPGLDRKIRTASGTMHVHGRVRGYISGVIDAEVNGILTGQINASIATGDMEVVEDHPALEEGATKQ